MQPSYLSCPNDIRRDIDDPRRNDGHHRYFPIVRTNYFKFVIYNVDRHESRARYPDDEDDYNIVWRVLEESQRNQLRSKARELTGVQPLSSEQWVSKYQTNLENLLKVNFRAAFSQ